MPPFRMISLGLELEIQPHEDLRQLGAGAEFRFLNQFYGQSQAAVAEQGRPMAKTGISVRLTLG